MPALLSILLLPFASSLAIAAAGRWIGARVLGLLAAALSLGLAVRLATLAPRVIGGEAILESVRWAPSLGVELGLALDGFSLFFALLVTGMGTLILLYASGYLSPREDVRRFYAYMLAFMGAMLGVVLSTSLITVYVFWELTSVTSFLLIGYWYHKEGSRHGAQKSLLITVSGGLAMLLGFVLVYAEAGTFDLRQLAGGGLRDSPLYGLILVLILAGAFSKSAQVPFHLWLPNAMEAPTPVSAFLHSATMVKAGLYLVARMLGILGGTGLWTVLVTGVGIASLVWGAALALRQTDLKALLANSTVSQLGLIMSLFGIGTPAAVAAGVFHTLNHALFKGALFLVAGIIEHETGTRDIRRLRGLGRFMPLTAAAAGLAALALAGIPPLNGFVSKEMFFEAALHLAEERGRAAGSRAAVAAWAVPALAVLGSIFTLVYSLIFFHGVFLRRGAGEGHGPGGPRTTPGTHDTHDVHETHDLHHLHDPTWTLVGPPLGLGLLALALGLFPDLVSGSLLTPAVSGIVGEWTRVKAALWHGVTPALLMSAVVIAAGLAGYGTRERWMPRLPELPEAFRVNTWYDRMVHGLPAFSERLTRAHVTGRLADHLLIFVGAAVLVWAYVLLRWWGLGLPDLSLGPVDPFDVGLAALMVAGALATLFLRSRIGLVMVLGTVGMSMALLFASFRAPDLAITQLIVESIALVLFVLVFSVLPALESRQATSARGSKASGRGPLPGGPDGSRSEASGSGARSLRSRGLAAPLAVAFGGLTAAFTLVLAGNKPFASISPYFVENSLPLGGGRNVVNVILVDFRGLDTMGEITVLAIAGIAVAALLRAGVAAGRLPGRKQQKGGGPS